MKFAYVTFEGKFYTSSDPSCTCEPCAWCRDYNTMEDLARIMFQDDFKEDYILDITGYEVQFVKKKEKEEE
ncbi:hypothetical protein [Granulicatella adiacens]|uniref:hypothetical protein n=1 Tax=Granulicatella adiacens TaxID=46124 RepID=UPI004027C617